MYSVENMSKMQSTPNCFFFGGGGGGGGGVHKKIQCQNAILPVWEIPLQR